MCNCSEYMVTLIDVLRATNVILAFLAGTLVVASVALGAIALRR